MADKDCGCIHIVHEGDDQHFDRTSPGNRLTSLDRFAALLPSCFQKIDRFLQLRVV
jgi:hypothetical protein